MSDEASLRLLIERLCWPVRLVRWKVAQEYGALITSKRHAKLALAVYFDWLSRRRLESEVVSGLSVLKCLPERALPPMSTLRANINAPSILADLIVQSVYGYGQKFGGWINAHSGTAPGSFEVSRFFLEYKESHVPPVLWHRFTDLQKDTRIDFPKQWGFEWQSVMDRTKSTHSGYPYYFIGSSYRETGVSGQFSQRQDDVYRSAFLRTLAWGVSRGMPLEYANHFAGYTLTLNNDFANLKPMTRPNWLGTLPEECCEESAKIEAFCKRLIENGRRATNAVPISVKVPISPEVQKFADVRLSAVLASPDFESEGANVDQFQWKFWRLGESSSFNQSLGKDEVKHYVIQGAKGTCMPIASNIWPEPVGFWHNDYISTGVALPMSFTLSAPATVVCREDSLAVEVGGSTVSTWQVWHDNFSPLYPRGGNSRCGMLTTMLPGAVAAAEKGNGRKLGWIAQVRIWKSEKDYSPLELSENGRFFFDKP